MSFLINPYAFSDVTAPTVTSSNSASVAENAVLAHSLTANESVTWSIVGGADQSKFEISGSTLRWASNGTKDYEAPDDADANNTYVVQVRATDGAGNTADQAITVTVTDTGDAPTDPYFANVVLLTGFDGVDGATSATDDSNVHRALTFVGNAQIDTAQKKFGTASLLCDGSGDGVSMPDSDDWYFPGEFTIEAWVRPNFSAVATGAILGQWPNINPNCNLYLEYFYGSATSKRFGAGFSTNGNPTGATFLTPASTNIDQSVFHHVCLERDAANKLRLYVGGVMAASAAGVSGNLNVSGNFWIGARAAAGAISFNGWIDDVRITKGVARYASDAGFSVPTAAFPRS